MDSKIKFASWQAEALAIENSVSFPDGFFGSGKNGAVKIQDVHGLILDKKILDQENGTLKPTPIIKKLQRYRVEKHPSGHVDKYNVIDRAQPDENPNRIVRDYAQKSHAEAECNRLNELNK